MKEDYNSVTGKDSDIHSIIPFCLFACFEISYKYHPKK